MTKKRIAVALLTVSLAGFGVWKADEGFTHEAVIPTKGDVPTIGHGSTRYENGTPVKMTDPPITRERGAILARNLLSQEEVKFKASLPPDAVLHPEEYDLYNNWVGQYGMGNWYKPKSPRTWLIQKDYVGACKALLNWRFAAGYDCSTLINGRPNKRCYGVWTRQLERHDQCMAVQ